MIRDEVVNNEERLRKYEQNSENPLEVKCMNETFNDDH